MFPYCYRVENKEDAMPLFPPYTMDYRHPCHFVHITDKNNPEFGKLYQDDKHDSFKSALES